MEEIVLALLVGLALLALVPGHRRRRHHHHRRGRAVRLQIVLFNPKGNAMGLLKLVKNGDAKPFQVVALNADGDVVALPAAVVLTADIPANVDFTVDDKGAATGKGKALGTGKFTATCADLASDTADYEVDADPVAKALAIVFPTA